MTTTRSGTEIRRVSPARPRRPMYSPMKARPLYPRTATDQFEHRRNGYNHNYAEGPLQFGEPRQIPRPAHAAFNLIETVLVSICVFAIVFVATYPNDLFNPFDFTATNGEPRASTLSKPSKISTMFTDATRQFNLLWWVSNMSDW